MFTDAVRCLYEASAQEKSNCLSTSRPIPTRVRCDECGETMVIRTGRNGQFLGCSKYPKCRHSTPMPEGETADSLAVSAS
ncbi:MAG: topoisomerase DNA-binding C4 zinc finger domain-containing protein [Planctomycetes bacterium]|nr:topoisomerase DNA-binding C4 zinc finger domain-containing protein [Planctomycetota bacterium]